ncbi:MAG: D-alanyl-D-alanine carboxypeptidase/D-alanyl-D-alanine-endopeptidase [Burkholderiaceae bacterium]
MRLRYRRLALISALGLAWTLPIGLRAEPDAGATGPASIPATAATATADDVASASTAASPAAPAAHAAPATGAVWSPPLPAPSGPAMPTSAMPGSASSDSAIPDSASRVAATRVAVAPSQAPAHRQPAFTPTRWPAEVALPAELAQVLRASGVTPEHVGMMAIEVSEGQALAAWNAQQGFNPASTMKLLTTYAALSTLGPDYRWRTRAYLGGRLQGDVLHGDLILKGGGDPKLVIEDLTAFVAQMRAAGLREIRGDLLLDDSIYLPDGRRAEAIDGDPSQPYNVQPYGLLMNFKATRLTLQPRGKRVSLMMDPPLADIEIDNAIKLAPGKCRYGVGGLQIRDGGSDARPAILVSGPFSPACGEQGTFAAVLTHRQFIHSLFKAAWTAAGGIWQGQTRVMPGAARGKPWQEWVSPRTLADVVQDVNKFSNNVMARQLLLQIAAERHGAPATLDQARQVLDGWLASRGLRFPELVVENGSGLSRIERISPQHLAELLRDVAISDIGDIMRGSMPRVGVDGTMRHRLVGQPIAGNAWVKTGTLNDVRAVAGFVDAAGGKRYAVAMMVNGPRAEASLRALDAFLSWVYENG